MSGSNFVFPNSISREGEKHLNRQFAADHGDRIPASGMVRTCSFHYTIASQAIVRKIMLWQGDTNRKVMGSNPVGRKKFLQHLR